MHSVLHAVLRSWSIPPAVSFALALTAMAYLRGWWLLRRAGFPRLPPWRAASFVLGLLTVWVALASPLDTFSGFVLTAHMLQHMLLMMVAPPLILLGCPLIPMVRGLPRFAAREFAGPLLNWRIAQRVGQTLTHPVCGLTLMMVVNLAWHTPRLYEMALASPAWHQVEHGCFFLASLLFWWPVIQPWPSEARWPRWAMVPYLVIADLQNTVLSAILVFSDRVLYPSYARMPQLFGLSPPEDQAAAGSIMWVVGSLAFLVPAVILAVQCLTRKPSLSAAAGIPQRRASAFDGVLALAQEKSSGRIAEALSFVVLFVVTGAAFTALLSIAPDDDQVLRAEKQSGGLAVSVFAPAEIATGANSFAVLVQNRASRVVQMDAAVELAARAADGVAVSGKEDDSENKLLKSAEVNFAAPGEWMVNVLVRHHAESVELAVPVQVVKNEAGLSAEWSYFLFPAIGMFLAIVFGVRRAGKSARVERPAVV